MTVYLDCMGECSKFLLENAVLLQVLISQGPLLLKVEPCSRFTLTSWRIFKIFLITYHRNVSNFTVSTFKKGNSCRICKLSVPK